MWSEMLWASHNQLAISVDHLRTGETYCIHKGYSRFKNSLLVLVFMTTPHSKRGKGSCDFFHSDLLLCIIPCRVTDIATYNKWAGFNVLCIQCHAGHPRMFCADIPWTLAWDYPRRPTQGEAMNSKTKYLKIHTWDVQQVVSHREKHGS